MATSNAAYASSGVNLRLNLVGTALTTGAQGTDAELILNRLRAGSDGYFDNLSSLRESKGADLVSLLTDANIGYCGIAFYPMAGGSYGQSVIAQSCAVDNLSFPHEVGHNLGAAHDRYVDFSGYYSYGFGYINLAQRWRTIMAYNNQCADSGFNCTRIARFSGPSVSWNGLPAGNTTTDNARALNTTAAMVAGYRTPSRQEVAVRVSGRGGVSASATAAYLNITVTGPRPPVSSRSTRAARPDRAPPRSTSPLVGQSRTRPSCGSAPAAAPAMSATTPQPRWTSSST